MKKRVISFILILAMFLNIVGVIPSFADLNTPEVSTGDANEITASSAVLFGSILKNGGANITDCGIIYGTKKSNMNMTASLGYKGDQKGEFSLQLSNLEMGQKYYYAFYAVNEIGMVKGSTEKFTTKELTVPEMSTYNAENIAETTAFINGEILKNGGYEISEYGFEVGTSRSNLNNKIALGSAGSRKFPYQATIKPLQPDTKYYFRSYATNQLGTGYGDVNSFKTKKLEQPEVSTKSISEVTSSSAVLSGEVLKNGGFDILDYGFVLFASGNEPQNFSLGYLGDQKGTYTYSSYELLPNTTYNYYAYITNQNGLYKGESKSFKTQNVESAEVKTIGSSDISQSTAVVKAEILKNGGFNILEYGFYYGPSSGSQMKLSLGVANDQKFPFETMLGGLEANTRYYFKPYVINQNGEYTGNQNAFTTTEPQQAEVKTHKATEITGDAAVVNGEVIKNGGYNITKYGFLYGTKKYNLTEQVSLGELGAQKIPFNFKLTSLDPGTVYYYRAFAETELGSSNGELCQFTTGKMYPPTVKTDTVSDITATQVTLNGELIKNGGYDIVDFGFYYGTNSSNKQKVTLASERYAGSDKFNFSKVIDGLQPGQKYYVQSYAVNQLGETLGNNYYFETVSAPKASVKTLSATEINSSSVVLNGELIKNGGYNVTDYGFKYGTSKSNLAKVTLGYIGDQKSAFKTFLSGLKPETKYYFQAYSENIGGISEGDFYTFTTLKAIVPVVYTAPEVMTYSAESIFNSSFVARGDVLKNGGAEITDYGFLYGLSSINLNQKLSLGSLGAEKGAYSAQISDLKASTSYFFKAYATNQVNTVYGPVITVKTSNKAPIRDYKPIREDLMTLESKFPNLFSFKLAITSDNDSWVETCLDRFAEVYGINRSNITEDEFFNKLDEASKEWIYPLGAGLDNAKSNLKKLAQKYPEIFDFKLTDVELNNDYLKYVKIMGYTNKYTRLEELQYYMYKDVNSSLNLTASYRIQAEKDNGTWVNNELPIYNYTNLHVMKCINGVEYKMLDSVVFKAISNEDIVAISGNKISAKYSTREETQTALIDAYNNNQKVDAKSFKIIVKSNVDNTTVTTDVTTSNNVIVLQIGNPYIDINGKKQLIDSNNRLVTPIIQKETNRSFVPISAVVKAMGGTVEWDGTNSRVIIKLDDELSFRVGENYFYKNDIKESFDVSPFIIEGRTMFPIKALENLGLNVSWDSNDRKVIISKMIMSNGTLLNDDYSILNPETIVPMTDKSIKLINNMQDLNNREYNGEKIFEWISGPEHHNYYAYYEYASNKESDTWTDFVMSINDGVYNGTLFMSKSHAELTEERAKEILRVLLASEGEDVFNSYVKTELTQIAKIYSKYAAVVVSQDGKIFEDAFGSNPARLIAFEEALFNKTMAHINTTGKLPTIVAVLDVPLYNNNTERYVKEIGNKIVKNKYFIKSLKAVDRFGVILDVANISENTIDQFAEVIALRNASGNFIDLLKRLEIDATLDPVKSAARKLRIEYESKLYSALTVVNEMIDSTEDVGIKLVVSKILGWKVLATEFTMNTIFKSGSLSDNYDRIQVISSMNEVLGKMIDEKVNILIESKNPIDKSIAISNVYGLTKYSVKLSILGENSLLKIIEHKNYSSNVINNWIFGDDLLYIPIAQQKHYAITSNLERWIVIFRDGYK